MEPWQAPLKATTMEFQMPTLVRRTSSVPHARLPLEEQSSNVLTLVAEAKRRWQRACRVEVRMATSMRYRAVIIDGDWELQGDVEDSADTAVGALLSRSDVRAVSVTVRMRQLAAANEASAAQSA